MNTDLQGVQVLTVVTTRLVLAWRDGDLVVTFEMQRVRTAIQRRASNDPVGRRDDDDGEPVTA